jgi:hypothetical protein
MLGLDVPLAVRKARRRMFTIGKPAEFGSNNLPVRGQCQPHTKGWRLRYFTHGAETLLHVDTYYACREMQKACIGLTLDAARAKVREMSQSISADLMETQKLPANLEDTVGDDFEPSKIGRAHV